MRTPTILALVAATLALSGAALAADVHVDQHGAVETQASLSASAPGAPSAPQAPAAPAAPPLPVGSAPSAPDVLQLASTSVSTPQGAPVSVGASADASAKTHGSPGEAIAHAVV